MCHPVSDAWVAVKTNPISRFNNLPTVLLVMVVIAVFQLCVNTTAEYCFPHATAVAVVVAWGVFVIVFIIAVGYIMFHVVYVSKRHAVAIDQAYRLVQNDLLERGECDIGPVLHMLTKRAAPPPRASSSSSSKSASTEPSSGTPRTASTDSAPTNAAPVTVIPISSTAPVAAATATNAVQRSGHRVRTTVPTIPPPPLTRPVGVTDVL